MGWVVVGGSIFHLVVISVHNKNIFKITQLGSNWNNGSNAGSFYWNLNNSVGNRNRNISSHLVNAWLISGSPKGLSVFIYKNCGNYLTLPLGKTQKPVINR